MNNTRQCSSYKISHNGQQNFVYLGISHLIDSLADPNF